MRRRPFRRRNVSSSSNSFGGNDVGLAFHEDLVANDIHRHRPAGEHVLGDAVAPARRVRRSNARTRDSSSRTENGFVT